MHSFRHLLVCALSLLVVGIPLAQTPHTHQHSFSGADGWAKVFDDPERDRWQKPHEVIVALKLASNSVVADIGAGTGYFSARLAHMTPGGRVYAVDLEPDMVKYLGERAKRDGLKNLVAVQAKPDSPELPDKVDRILLVDTYHHISERVTYFKRLRDTLKPDGQVAIIDFTADSPVGPPKSDRISARKVAEEMTLAGYTQVAQHVFLPYQFYLVFEPTQ
ncbi:MAG: SAM-dependent methyltransferase [Burkholderiaceae bacterium]|jgi:cyclopropane fatty-acyl-phospholipid synthase-like methyltransferase|nr:SAM-dependent methyltransferase [Burkholderiaceae bacterium]